MLPEKLSNLRGLEITIWYIKIFGITTFIKLSFFYLNVLLKNYFKKINTFKELSLVNKINCTYIDSMDDKLFIDNYKKDKKKYYLVFTNHIIKNKFLTKKYNIFINKHSSLLPSYSGLLPFVWTKIFQASNGISIHLISKKIDQGKIIFQKKINLKFESMIEFYIYIYEKFPKYLIKSISNLEKKKFINSSYKKSTFSIPKRKEFKKFISCGGKVIQFKDFLLINRIIK